MKRFDQINMIPFIDIMLVLLAIVLTTASFVSKGLIDVDIPSANQVTTTNQESIKAIEIAVNIENKLFFNEVEIDISQLKNKLKTYESDQNFVIRMDKKSDFEHFINIIDVMKAANFKKISIQAEQKQQP
ncbi:MAG: biopolymer transport protein ExbD [Cocleimonas sp.]|jgi:biopolymer transport protein ExbD